MSDTRDGQAITEQLATRIERLTPASAADRETYTALLRDIAEAAHEEDENGEAVLDANQVDQMQRRIVERTGMKLSKVQTIYRDIVKADFGIGADLEKPLRDAADDPEVKRVASEYPLPQQGDFVYLPTKEGVMMHKVLRAKNGAVVRAIVIASPFTVPARARFVDSASPEAGLRVAVQCPRGHRVLVDIESGHLAAPQTRHDHLARLMKAGLRVGAGREEVLNVLGLARPDGEILMVRRPGFIIIEKAPIFVTIDGRILGGDAGVELAGGAQVDRRVARRGLPRAAKKLIATVLSTPDTPHWKIGFLVGLAGPVIAYAHLPNCGINLSGSSSIGKSFAQELAVWPWSTPDGQVAGSLYRYAHATVNGLEGIAVLSDSMVMSVDELALMAGKQLAQLIFMFVAGTDKVRMNRNVALRDARHWSSAAIFSYEKTLEEKVRADGGQWTAGMATRIPNVPVVGTNVAVPKDQIDGFRHALRRCYGHLGPAFVAQLLTLEPVDIRQRVAAKRQTLIASTELATRQRAAEVFALLGVTGDLVHECDLVPSGIDFDEAVSWAFLSFLADAIPLDPVEEGIQRLKSWVAERWDSSIRKVWGIGGAFRDAVGFYDDECVYIPAHRLVEAAGGGLSERVLGRALKERGLTIKFKDAEHLTTGHVPGYGGLKAYALSRKYFGAPESKGTHFGAQFGINSPGISQ